MGDQWQILFCDGNETACPVSDFLNQCRPRHQVKVLRILSLLEEQGPVMPRPYADTLRDGIHELRFTLSRDKVRVLYFFCYQKFIVLYDVFFKNTRRVPEKYINQVMDYRQAFLDRTSLEQLEEASLDFF